MASPSECFLDSLSRIPEGNPTTNEGFAKRPKDALLAKQNLDSFPRISKADSVGEPVGFSTLQPSVAEEKNKEIIGTCVVRVSYRSIQFPHSFPIYLRF